MEVREDRFAGSSGGFVGGRGGFLVLVAASAAALAAVASEAAEGSQVATAEVVEALEVVLGAVIVEHLPQEWAIVAMLQYLPTTSRTMLRVEGAQPHYLRPQCEIPSSILSLFTCTHHHIASLVN